MKLSINYSFVTYFYHNLNQRKDGFTCVCPSVGWFVIRITPILNRFLLILDGGWVSVHNRHFFFLAFLISLSPGIMIGF